MRIKGSRDHTEMAAIIPGVYYIQNVATNNVMELPGGSATDGTNVVGHTKRALSDTEMPSQLWIVNQVGTSDAFTILNTRSGSLMDLSGGKFADGTPIIGYRENDGKNQNWIIQATSDGKAFVIKNQATNTFATLLNGGISNGTPIQGFKEISGNVSQHWVFVHA